MSDALYHRLFAHPLLVEQLIRDFVPEAMAVGLDFAGLERINPKFHDRRGWREGDVIWRLPTRSDDLYLCVLLEFQSRSDWFMAVRTGVYQGLLWQEIIAERQLKTGDRLPPVLLIVLYNGEARWSAPATLGDLIALPPGSALWPWQPQARYYLLDMGAVPDAELARRDSLTALLIRLERRPDPAALQGLVGAVVKWFRRHPGYDTLKQAFTDLVRQALQKVSAPADLPPDLARMQAMLATLSESWIQQWKAEGRAEGKAEGRAEGKAEGRAEGKAELLLRLLHRRFGPAVEPFEPRVREADPVQLDRWAERLLDAKTPDDVFGDP